MDERGPTRADEVGLEGQRRGTEDVLVVRIMDGSSLTL